MLSPIPHPRRMHSRIIIPATVLVLALALGGFASVGSPAQSTLSQAEQLTPQTDGTRAWRAAGVGVTAFHLPADGLAIGPEVGLDEAQRSALRKAFAQALATALREAGWRETGYAGPDVVSVRGAITEVAVARPALNAVTTVLLLAPLSRGGLTLEVEGRTQGNGERVAALSFKGQAGVQHVGSAFSATGHAEGQAELAARKFADVLLQRAPKPTV